MSDLLAEHFSSDAGLKIKITIWCGQRQARDGKTHWSTYCEQIDKTDGGRDSGTFGDGRDIFSLSSPDTAD
ncbi:hypothetical protein CS537_20580 [Yersinia mollaretii]|nr:hypothetical protein CS537_20580 [Yersinia mollaretii]